MVQQFHLAATGLATKLAALSREHRKGDAPHPNFAVYIVCPFPRQRKEAVAALLRAAAPLVTSMECGTPLDSAHSSIPSVLTTSPWKVSMAPEGSVNVATSPNGAFGSGSPGGGGVSGLCVRILPLEAVTRYGPPSTLRERSPRLQMLKAFAFSVFNSLRNKRLRRGLVDGEVLDVSSHVELADDRLSPMTPDCAPIGSPSSCATPGSPAASCAPEETSSGPVQGASPPEASLSSFLYEPAVTLSGVGRQTGEITGCAEFVFHLAYSFCEKSSRLFYAWVDSRGETLDVSNCTWVGSLASARRKLLQRMWTNGQRWWVPYSDATCVTISRLGGAYDPDEKAEWETIVRVFVSTKMGATERRPEAVRPKLRFLKHTDKPECVAEGVDVLREAATPATPASLPAPSSAPSGAPKPETAVLFDRDAVSSLSHAKLRSVSLLTYEEADSRDLFTHEATAESVVVTQDDSSVVTKASLILEDYGRHRMRQHDISVVSHFGIEGSHDGCAWDAKDSLEIARCIGENFSALRFVGCAPSWPLRAWAPSHPLHVDMVWKMRSYCQFVRDTDADA